MIYAVTVVPFTAIYALTVSPFTVQFFRTFAQSPDLAGMKLVGIWPLAKVHEFFLPLFVFALEVISIQLAASVWSLWMSRSRRFSVMLPALGVLFFAQAFPTFSVYLDSRNTQFIQVKDKELTTPDPLEVEKVRTENRFKVTQYNLAKQSLETDVGNRDARFAEQVREIEAQLASEERNRNARLTEQIREIEAQLASEERNRNARLAEQIRDIERQLGSVNAAIAVLQQRANIAWTEAHWAEYNKLSAIRDELQRGLAAAQAERRNAPDGELRARLAAAQAQGLNPTGGELRARLASVQAQRQELIANPPSAGPLPTLSTEPTSQPKYNNVVQYMTDTAGRTDALLSLFVALIFPAVVLAGGYVIARYIGGDALDTTVRSVRIESELRIAELLPKNHHMNFAEFLKPVITSRVAMMRSEAGHLVASTGFTLETSHELDLMKWASSVARAIANSDLTEQAKATLTAHLEKVVSPATSNA